MPDDIASIPVHSENEESEEIIVQLQEHIASLENELQRLKADAVASQSPGDNQPVEKLTVENLLKAGVTQGVAEEVIRRLGQHEFQLLQLQDKAKRESYLDKRRYYKERRQLMKDKPSLRQSIGDDAYDRYLYQTQQNNRVLVSSVMSGSVAEQLGVINGDIILSYADQQVINWQDLRQLTAEGVYGEYVNLKILRDHQLINILVPRGALGVKLTTTRIDPDTEYNY